MAENETSHISHISSAWTKLRQALAGENGPQRRDALQWLEERYGPPVRRFLGKLACETAEDLYQEFWMRLLDRKYRNAKPEVGRFRHYLKKCLKNLHYEHVHKIHRTCPLPENWEPATAETPDDIFTKKLNEEWRQELLERAAKELESLELRKQREGNDCFYYTVFKFCQQNADLHSHELAPLLAQELGKQKLTADPAGWVRKQRYHARKHFRQFLKDEIAISLEEPNAEQIQAELRELDLLKYFPKGGEKKD